MLQEAHNDTNSVGNPSNSQASNEARTSSTLKEPKETSSLRTDAKRNPTTNSVSKKRKSKDVDEPNLGVDNPKAKVKRSVAKTKNTHENSLTSPSDQGKGVVNELEPALQDNIIKESPEPDSESDMSVVIDEKPTRKGKTKGSKSRSGKPLPNKVPKSQASKKTDDKPVDANADEIKRLQGWLIKCGIRKMWYRELAPYDTPKLKIQHLKEMLSDAGMTGRYSLERATQIRNERELKAELEAVQEGDKHWGRNESDGEEGPVKPRRRRLAKGLQELDMILNGSGGEETD